MTLSDSGMTGLPKIFETVRLLLRPVTIQDVDAIFETYAQDEEVTRYLIWRPHRSRTETESYVECCIGTPSEVERTYVVVGRDDGLVRGAFALRRRAPHRLDCGYVLARRWWRQGLMISRRFSASGLSATWITLARRGCWKKPASSGRGY